MKFPKHPDLSRVYIEMHESNTPCIQCLRFVEVCTSWYLALLSPSMILVLTFVSCRTDASSHRFIEYAMLTFDRPNLVCVTLSWDRFFCVKFWKYSNVMFYASFCGVSPPPGSYYNLGDATKWCMKLENLSCTFWNINKGVPEMLKWHRLTVNVLFVCVSICTLLCYLY